MTLHIFYAAGPGDVIGTYEYWKSGREDPRELSMTYSGQFYSLCRELGACALVVAQRPGGRCVKDGSVTIRECATPFGSRNALLYHMGQAIGAIQMAWHARRFGAELAVVSNGTHWFMLCLLKLLGICVVPDLHCTLWPTGHPPAKPIRRLVAALNGQFWRSIPSATLCISPECERQVMQVARHRAGNLLPTRPTYRRHVLDQLPAPNHQKRPFVLLYAGRIERDKGVFDLLEVMQRLESTHPGAFRCVLCGTGSAQAELAQAARQSGMTSVVRLAGQLQQDALRSEMAAAHAVIVPTTSSFVEGLNRVAVEAVLVGRPAIVTSVCPASELIAEAAIIVQPGDVTAMYQAAERLAGDNLLYEKLHAACLPLAAQFYDVNHSWGAQLKKAIQHALPEHLADAEIARRFA